MGILWVIRPLFRDADNERLAIAPTLGSERGENLHLRPQSVEFRPQKHCPWGDYHPMVH